MSLMSVSAQAQAPQPAQPQAQQAPQATAAPHDAYLYIIWPNNNERIKGAFWCRFGLRGMGIARAGGRIGVERERLFLARHPFRLLEERLELRPAVKPRQL
jgi:hypothetical protein